jgi:transposase
MENNIRFVGFDVHAATIAVAVAEGSGEVSSLGVIPNQPDAVRKLIRRLGPADRLWVCYEAGPCGYALYWQMIELGVKCEVVAPTLIPVKPGERVKTDRRDARKLARSYRAGDLTAVWVPDRAHEALRDLVRAREVAKADQLRARHRLLKLLLRQGRRPPAGVRAWSAKWWAWIKEQRFEYPLQQTVLLDYIGEVEHAAARIQRLEQALALAVETAPEKMRAVIEGLQALRGIARLSALTIVSEVGQLSRFARARQLMAYSGLVPSEHSSGEKIRRGSITKTGNAHLRRVLLEAAWTYRHRPAVGASLRARQERISPEVKAIAWKGQQRLCNRYQRLLRRGKPACKVASAVARELLGFIWAIGVRLEREPGTPTARPSANKPSAGRGGARRSGARRVLKTATPIQRAVNHTSSPTALLSPSRPLGRVSAKPSV